MKLSSTAGTPLSSPSPARLAPAVAASNAATSDVATAGAIASDARAVSLAAPKKTPVTPPPVSTPPVSTPTHPAPTRPTATRPAPPREVVIERKPKNRDDDSNSNSGGAPKKRVRLKPETPEQLTERLRNPQLSLHEASILLRVSRATVRRYADSGRINCQRTPGGQRRFFLRDIENFYRQMKLKR